jgi:hypothetical protein
MKVLARAYHSATSAVPAGRLRFDALITSSNWSINQKQVVLFALFAAELLVITTFALPSLRSFQSFAFEDWGSNFTVQYLLSQGLRPNIDFGYHYGTLPLLLAHLWFALAGFTPASYIWGTFLCNLFVGWAIARLSVDLALGPLGLILLMVAMPHALQVSYPNFAHALEPVLLASAIAEQVRGRRDTALVLTTVSCFVKPSLGYVYSLLLVTIIFHDLISTGSLTIRRVLQRLTPAISVAAVGFLVLSRMYGIRPTGLSLLPIAGATAYAKLHYGVFYRCRPPLLVANRRRVGLLLGHRRGILVDWDGMA